MSKSEISLSSLVADEARIDLTGRTELAESNLDNIESNRETNAPERAEGVSRRLSAPREVIEQSALLNKFSDEEGEDNFEDSRITGEDLTFMKSFDDQSEGASHYKDDDDDDDFDINIPIDDSDSESDDGDD